MDLKTFKLNVRKIKCKLLDSRLSKNLNNLNNMVQNNEISEMKLCLDIYK